MCGCITKVNELVVREKGVRLCFTTNLTTGLNRMCIATEVAAGKKKPRGFNLLPSYCPFCGEKYPEDR